MLKHLSAEWPSRKMGRSLFTIAATSSALAVIGCSEPVAQLPAKPAPVPVTATTMRVENESPQLESLDVEESELELEIAETFFSVPESHEVSQLANDVQSDQQQSTVRLIGIVGQKGSPDRKALLKIGNSLDMVVVGEESHGVKLLSIEDRSITLQRDRHRWSLSMFEQPLVNKPVAPPVRKRRSQSHEATDFAEQPVDEPPPIEDHDLEHEPIESDESDLTVLPDASDSISDEELEVDIPAIEELPEFNESEL